MGLGMSLCFFLPAEAFAATPAATPTVSSATQTDSKTVKGTVVDANGDAVIGATVLEKGSPTNGTTTDVDGNFVLDVPKGAVIVISYIGFSSQEIVAGTQTEFKITMKEDSQTLDDVVVVGFGVQKKANLTGATSSVKMEEVLGDRPITNASQALQGTVPGLTVSSNGNQPGKGKSFQIRGAQSLRGKIAPLVLIDNVEGDIDMLNPQDIESISVMKDAASSAIYGARAAGGVILITTKHPKKGEAFTLNYNNNFAFSKATNLPEQAPLDQFLKAYSDCCGDQYWSLGSPSVARWQDLLTQYRQDPSSLDVRGDGIYKDADGAVYYLNEKDLVKNMLETSFMMNHNISASGSTEKLRYRVSGGYTTNDGILISDKDKYRRLNISSFVSADIKPWFTQEANLTYAHSTFSLPASSFGGVYSTRLNSYYPEGICPEGVNSMGGEGYPFFTPRNQVLYANPEVTKRDNARIFLKSIFKPVKGLEIAFEYTYDKKIKDYHWYAERWEYTTIQGGVQNAPNGDDYLKKVKDYTDYNAFNIYATYKFDIKDHHFSVMAGFNQEKKYTEGLEAYSYKQAIPDLPSMGSGTSSVKVFDSYNEIALRGGFFRINYNYKDRYLFEVNGRYDGSSKFPKNDRFGFFPSVSAAWRVTEEKFMEGTRDWMSNLKLSASYGVIGNQNIPNYAYSPTMALTNKYKDWLVNGDYTTAITNIPQLVSSSFTWEKVHTLNLGLDMSFLNNRLEAGFAWYQKDTKGMLAPGMQLPAVIGIGAPQQNTADMRTRGWDLNLSWRDKIGKVGYRVSFILQDFKSKITKYDNNESKLLTNGQNQAINYEGKDLGEIWGYVSDGYYTVDDFESTSSWILKEGVTSIDGISPRPGDMKFKNLRDDDYAHNMISDGDNTLANPGDRKVIGNTTPRYQYGFNLGLNYAGFDLNVFFQGTGKRDAWIDNNLVAPMRGDYKFVALYEGTNDYWQPRDAAAGDYTAINPNAKFPRIYGNYGNAGSNYRKSDKFLSDASYLRLKNITLSYSLPKKWISKISLKQMKVFLSVENVATWTDLPKGIDPEQLNWNYPLPRTISFGANISF